jgi:hypothetical protein
MLLGRFGAAVIRVIIAGSKRGYGEEEEYLSVRRIVMGSYKHLRINLD